MPLRAFKPKQDLTAVKKPIVDAPVGLPQDLANRISSMAITLAPPVPDEEVLTRHFRISTDLATTGKSQDVTDILFNEAVKKQALLSEDALLAIQDPFLTEEEKFFRMFTLAEDKKAPVSIKTAFLERFAIAAETEGGNADRLQGTTIRHLEDIRQSRGRIRAEKEGVELNYDDNKISDFLVSILPGSTAPQVVDVITEVFPDMIQIGHNIAAGQLIQETKKRLRDMDFREREEKVIALLNAIGNNKFLGGNNRYVKGYVMGTLLDDYEDSDWERVFNSAIGILDASIALEGLRLGKFAGKAAFKKVSERKLRKVEKQILYDLKHPGSVSSMIDDVAPEDSARLVAEALVDDTGRLAEQLGETVESMTASHVFPKPPGTPITTAPDVNRITSTIDTLDIRPSIFDAEEQAFAATAMDLRIKDLGTMQDYWHINKSEVKALPGGIGYEAKVIIGANPERPFADLTTAQLVAKKYSRELADKSNTTILARDFKTGEFEPFEAIVGAEARTAKFGKPGEREYLVQVDATHVLDETDALPIQMMLDTGNTGKVAKWMVKSSNLMDWLANAGRAGGAQNAVRTRELRGLLDPLTKMSRTKQSKVAVLIDDGMREKKWLTMEDIERRFGNDPDLNDIARGYHAFLKHQNLVWQSINEEVAVRLANEGQKSLRIAKGLAPDESQFMAKPTTTIPGSVKAVWDAKLGAIRTITRKEIDEVLGNEDLKASYFMELRRPMQHEGTIIDYVLVNSNKNAIVKQLPARVVRQNPGQVARIYDAAFVLEVKSTIRRNGGPEQDIWNTRTIYNNPGDATVDRARLLREMGLDPDDADVLKNGPVQVRPAKEITDDIDYASSGNMEVLERNGQLFTSPRGVEIKGIDGTDILRPIGQGIHAGQTKAARIGTIDLAVNKARAVWMQRYGELFELPANGSFPIAAKLKRTNRNVAFDRDVKDAVAARDHINLLAGVDNTALRVGTKKAVDSISGSLAGAGQSRRMNELSAFTLRQRNRNILNAPKMAVFIKWMTLRPIRQLIMQPQQMSIYMSLEGGAKYWLQGTGFADQAKLMVGLATRDNPGLLKLAAKAMNTTVKKMEREVDAFRKSGLMDEIDSHQYLSGATFNTDILKAHEKTWRNLLGDGYDVSLSTLKVLRTVGFDFGENIQLMGAFNGVRNRWMLRNPKKAHLWDQDENLQQIANEARALSWDMNQQGTLESQRNWAALASQFTSHAQKSLQFLIPEAVTRIPMIGKHLNKPRIKGIMSEKEKTFAILNQLAIYGTGAFGLNRFIEMLINKTGTDLPPDVISAVEEGIVGTALNMSLRAANGEEPFTLEEVTGLRTDIEFSQDIAPFSAILGGGGFSTMNNIVGRVTDAVLFQDRSVGEFFFGPSADLFAEAGRSIEFAAHLRGVSIPWLLNPQGVDITLPENDNEAARILDNFARKMVPMYNDFVRGRAELTAERLISTMGNEGFQATIPEILFRNTIGSRPRRSNRLQDLKQQLRLSAPPVDPILQTGRPHLDDAASTLYDVAITALEQRKDGRATDEEIMDLISGNVEGLRVLLEPADFAYIVDDALVRLHTSRINEVDAETEITEMLMRIYGTGSAGQPLDDAIMKIRNIPDFEHKQTTIEFLESMKNG